MEFCPYVPDNVREDFINGKYVRISTDTVAAVVKASKATTPLEVEQGCLIVDRVGKDVYSEMISISDPLELKNEYCRNCKNNLSGLIGETPTS